MTCDATAIANSFISFIIMALICCLVFLLILMLSFQTCTHTHNRMIEQFHIWSIKKPRSSDITISNLQNMHGFIWTLRVCIHWSNTGWEARAARRGRGVRCTVVLINMMSRVIKAWKTLLRCLETMSLIELVCFRNEFWITCWWLFMQDVLSLTSAVSSRLGMICLTC